jgi:hypothetical protein
VQLGKSNTPVTFPDCRSALSKRRTKGRSGFWEPVGSSLKERHHVRFWRMAKTDGDRPAWIGSAAYDIGVELSRTTGQVTHHISPNLDAERNLLVTDLTKAIPDQVRWVDGFHEELQGRNGGGDRWRTDGRLAVVTLPLTQGATSPNARADALSYARQRAGYAPTEIGACWMQSGTWSKLSYRNLCAGLI